MSTVQNFSISILLFSLRIIINFTLANTILRIRKKCHGASSQWKMYEGLINNAPLFYVFYSVWKPIQIPRHQYWGTWCGIKISSTCIYEYFGNHWMNDLMWRLDPQNEILRQASIQVELSYYLQNGIFLRSNMLSSTHDSTSLKPIISGNIQNMK